MVICNVHLLTRVGYLQVIKSRRNIDQSVIAKITSSVWIMNARKRYLKNPFVEVKVVQEVPTTSVFGSREIYSRNTSYVVFLSGPLKGVIEQCRQFISPLCVHFE